MKRQGKTNELVFTQPRGIFSKTPCCLISIDSLIGLLLMRGLKWPQFLTMGVFSILDFLVQPSQIKFSSSASRIVYADFDTFEPRFSRSAFQPSYGLLSNETGFLHLSCSQIFSLEIDFTNTIGSFSQLSVVINVGAEDLTSDMFAPVMFMFSFAVRCTV